MPVKGSPSADESANVAQAVRVMFDTSSVRNLEVRPQDQAIVRAAIDAGRVRMVIPRAVSEQLWDGHRKGHGPATPPFPCEYVGNTVGRLGLMAMGDSLGRGDHFDAHLGAAMSRRRIQDALVADAAAHHARILVSDDSDFLRQPRTLLPLVHVMDLAEFLRWITSEQLARVKPDPLCEEIGSGSQGRQGR